MEDTNHYGAPRPADFPPRPAAPAETRSGSLVPLTLAGLLLVVVCAVLFFLTLGGFAIVVIVGTLAFSMAALHYLVWGWWLGKMIRDDVEAEERESDET